MIKKNSPMTPEKRLDAILDNIHSGAKPSSLELRFLESFSRREEAIVNQEMCMHEREMFLSDDGEFSFTLQDIDRQSDCDIISGVIGFSAPALDGDHRAYGRILVFRRTHVAIDFTVGGHEILEVIPGREESLDRFVDDLYRDILGIES